MIQTAAAQFGWGNAVSPGRRIGFAFTLYKNLAGYAAVAVGVSVDANTKRVRLERAVASINAGEIVNPHGIREQIEDRIIQAMS